MTTLEKKLDYDHGSENLNPWTQYVQYDGMEQTLPSGCFPFVEPESMLKQERKDNEICFVVIRGEYGEIIMGVFRVIFEGSIIRLHLDDPAYIDRIVKEKDVLCMHRVDGYIVFRDGPGFENNQ